ncbi:MAG: hypothetical protein KDD99_31880 [Bacteroidetes bacterium]|nr:hypothetical protein [Bacteroidota bacterium]
MKTGLLMRVIHRYLGFFLVGIMAMYAISGMVMVFRNTDFLKKERQMERTIAANLSGEELGRELRIRGFQVEKQEGNMIYFAGGFYNQSTGESQVTVKSLPFLLEKMTKFHKATTDSPLYWLNIFFGISLLYFVVSTFWMFRPKTEIFKKGLYFTLGGIVLTILLLFV